MLLMSYILNLKSPSFEMQTNSSYFHFSCLSRALMQYIVYADGHDRKICITLYLQIFFFCNNNYVASCCTERFLVYLNHSQIHANFISFLMCFVSLSGRSALVYTEPQ